jgi:hypothetical protein
MPTLAEVLRQTGYAQNGTLVAPALNSPMTTALSEHIKGLPQQFQQNQAEQMALLGQAFPGNTYKSMMTEGDPKAMAELAMQVPVVSSVSPRKEVIESIFDKVMNVFGKGQKISQMPEGVIFERLHPTVQTRIKEGAIHPSDAQMMSDYAYSPGSSLVETGTGAYKDLSEKMQNYLQKIKDKEVSNPWE